MSEQCVSCIHVAVCAYRDTFEKVEKECNKYPFCVGSMRCYQYYAKPYGKRKKLKKTEVKPNE